VLAVFCLSSMDNKSSICFPEARDGNDGLASTARTFDFGLPKADVSYGGDGANDADVTPGRILHFRGGANVHYYSEQ